MSARTSPDRLVPLAWAVTLLFPFTLAGQDSRPTLVLPAFTGFAHPDPEGERRRDDGTVASCKGQLVFYVAFADAGEVQLRLDRGPAPAARLRTSLVAQVGPASSAQGSLTALSAVESAEVVDLGAFTIIAPGYHRIVLEHTDGSDLRALRRLRVEGPAARGATANTLERRNAASVHLGYPVPKADEDAVEWFYCEVTPRTDPLWTYYMATGWHRGYFGMQVNSETERRLIFSVWDSGHEGVDRAKVAQADRVELVAKGAGVVAEGFGHEGTGGHSHLVHPWKLGATFRFLVHAEVDGDHTTYTGWFWFAETRRWGLVASFRAPKDGQHLRGL